MALFSQDQVNNWFAQNPNATTTDVAQAVQGLGGLEANQGLAGLIGQHYGTDAATVNNAYNQWSGALPMNPSSSGVMNSGAASTATATPDSMGIATTSPQSVTDLYTQVLGRAPDAGGLAYWQQQFGDTVDPNELATFRGAAQAELANRTPAEQAALAPNFNSANAYTAPAQKVNADAYFAANPDVAAAYQANSYGLDPTQFAQAHYTNYGANEQRVNPADQNALYDQIVQGAYGTIGRTGVGENVSNIDQAGLDYWKGQLASGAINPQEFQNVFNNAVNVYKTEKPTDPYTQYVNNYQKTQSENGIIKDYVNSVLADKTLSPWEQTNKIMERAQQVGVTQDRLESVFGKDAVKPYLETYKQGINDFLTQTLAKDPGTTLNEVGAIHQAAQKYGLTPDEIAKYGGLDPNTVNAYFAQYDQGLGTIVAKLNDPKTDDLTKTQTALALAQKYGTTDAELAKASNGKWTEKDVAAYLDPVRNVPTNLQKLMDDPNATAADITKFINDAKKDPRAAGIFGVGLDKVLAASPELLMRDIQNGTGNVTENYNNFLAQAKATPESAAKYAPQIAAIEKVQGLISRAVDKDYGGKESPWMYEMFTGLNKKDTQKAPAQLEFSPPKKETRVVGGDEGGLQTMEVTVPGTVKPIPGLKVAESDEDGNPTKYIKEIDSSSFNVKPGERTHTGDQGLVAEYDAKGTLTGYSSGNRIYTSDPTWIGAKWDANGKSNAYGGYTGGGGFIKNTAQDVMSGFSDMGIAGQLALMYLTAGAGSALGGAMGGGLLGNAAASGLIGGTMSELGGGEFGKGFVGGAVGSGVGQLAQGAMPTGGFTTTGVPMVDSYLTQALPKVAGSMASAGVTGADMGDAGLYSLLNTGVNMGTNSLLQNSGIGTLDPTIRPYATGVASNLISSTLTGKDPNVQNAIMKTMLQQATSKMPKNTAAVP